MTQRVLLVRLSAMGDVVHSLPALELARARWPQAELWWAVEELAAPLLLEHPALDRVVVIPRKSIGRRRGALRSTLGSVAELRRAGFDAAIDLQGLLRSALVARGSGAPRVFGPAWAREGAALLYTDGLHVPRPPEAHAVARYEAIVSQAASALGAEESKLAPSLRLPAALLAPRAAHPRLVLLASAGKEANRLPPELLAGLADAARAELPGLEAFVLGGPGDRAQVDAIRRRAQAPIQGRVETRLDDSARLLASAWAVVGGDTGPLHLARALGAATLALFPAADPARTAPAGLPGDTPSDTIAGEVECAPCCARRCQRADRVRICLDALTLEVALARLLPLLR